MGIPKAHTTKITNIAQQKFALIDNMG